MLNILNSKYKEVLAVGISTVMFASLHIAYGPFYMLGAAVLLSVFGFVYNRQGSVWGLAIIHFTFGMSAMLLGLV